MPQPPQVAVVTSRQRRLIGPEDYWLSALRGALRTIAIEHQSLVIGENTASADLIRHAAIRLGLHIVNVVPTVTTVPDSLDVAPADQAVLDQADTVYVLGLRSLGNIHRLLRERLQRRQGNVFLVDLPELQSAAAKKELCDLGATMWAPATELRAPFERTNSSFVNEATTASAETETYQLVPPPGNEARDFLIHTTRSCPGPWPDQSFVDYANDLLESREEADHSVLGSLCRIVRQRLLIASNKTIRGGQPMVSFSACTLEQLPALHQFRPHRVRWDFEPYGLCIRREWLEQHGARPVYYGDQALWESLSEVDRPYFQLAIGESGIDWRVEQEWRSLGNLDLTNLTAADVILFVPNAAAAKSLAQVTDWPITLWPAPIDSTPDTEEDF